MKKILLIVSIISVLFLAGCNTKQNVNNDVMENNENQNQEEIQNDENTQNTDNIDEENKNVSSSNIELTDEQIDNLLKVEDVNFSANSEIVYTTLKWGNPVKIELNNETLELKIMNLSPDIKVGEGSLTYRIDYSYHLYINDNYVTTRGLSVPLYDSEFEYDSDDFSRVDLKKHANDIVINIGKIKDIKTNKEYLIVSNDPNNSYASQGITIYEYKDKKLLPIGLLSDHDFFGTTIPVYDESGNVISSKETWSYKIFDNVIYYRDMETNFKDIGYISLISESYSSSKLLNSPMATHKVSIVNGVLYDEIVKIYSNVPFGKTL